MDGEAACAVEPQLVACARECLEQREAVARGAVAETVALLVPVRARLPDVLGVGEQELLVLELPGAEEYSRSAVALL